MLGQQVEGPDGKGTVNVHMVRPREGARLEYKTLSLDVPGKTQQHKEAVECGKG